MSLKLSYDFCDYEPWDGAVETYEKIRDEGKLDELETYVTEIFGLTTVDETDINDLLWHDWESVFKALGIEDKDEDDDDDAYDPDAYDPDEDE